MSERIATSDRKVERTIRWQLLVLMGSRDFMLQVRRFNILPNIPDRLASLQRLARNLWWCWNPDAIALFRRLDEQLYTITGHNPVKLVGSIDQSRLDELSEEAGFLAHMDRVAAAFDHYMNAPTWFSTHYPKSAMKVAYFSAEFGLHESVPIYSGGLGVLAGDHLKSATELGIPLVGVGLAYQQGYFRQYLNADGWQQERYPENDFYTMPMELQIDSKGDPIKIGVEYPGRVVKAQIWRVPVGRVSLYLLDCNIPENSTEDREITYQLYGGDQDMRVRQELMLGVGGVRALHALKIDPTICHMNEGHSAFLAVERVINTMESLGCDFETAKEAVSSGCIFTTHTPVEAGNDMFPPYLVEQYLMPYCHRMKIDKETFLGLGRQNPFDTSEPFCMTVLAIRFAHFSNGVSKLHGKVSRRMWKKIWPELPETDVPIRSVTNGVHTKSILCSEMSNLFDRYLGPDWGERPDDHTVWQRVEQIPDSELWRTHERRRERLVAFARRRLANQFRARGAPAMEINVAEEVLDPDALTIGFARRFATYKRATLIFRDQKRLSQIVNDPKRPVQFIFAGKAHPRDNGGKELIAQIVHIARSDEFRRRIVFLEDYDMNVARYLVQGVDIWLNNPRRPLEASGTSGMKAPPNGGINLSVLDGWWVEGYARDNGWAIGSGEEYTDLNYQDEVEGRAIYDLLEKEIVPLFYDRSGDGLPRGWIKAMKQSIMTVTPVFNTNRMVQDYTERFYLPSDSKFAELSRNNLGGASGVAHWLGKIRGVWSDLKVNRVEVDQKSHLQVGKNLKVTAEVHLGRLTPGDIKVELYHGGVDASGNITSPQVIPMTPKSASGNLFEGEIPCRTSGQHGFAVRILPNHPGLARAYEPGLIRWG